MTIVGIISDTHGDLNAKVLEFFKDCSQVWHAGDIGSFDVIEKLSKSFELKAVSGNIDNWEMKCVFPLIHRFKCEDMNVLLIHIGGYPGRFEKIVKHELSLSHADIVVCGHSHILKVIYDTHFNLLHINPGAASIHGFHNLRTAIKITIDKKEIKELLIFELPK